MIFSCGEVAMYAPIMTRDVWPTMANFYSRPKENVNVKLNENSSFPIKFRKHDIFDARSIPRITATRWKNGVEE
jgi:hypothetical protein